MPFLRRLRLRLRPPATIEGRIERPPATIRPDSPLHVTIGSERDMQIGYPNSTDGGGGGCGCGIYGVDGGGEGEEGEKGEGFEGDLWVSSALNLKPNLFPFFDLGFDLELKDVQRDRVFQLKVNGVAFRLIPESTQVKNALKILFFRAASIIHGNCKIEAAANEESDGAGVSKKRP
ncbi:unnamed protein product [Arabidopsis lyrata]|nr:unnamed protein product [Arabidopsis lyrata]